MSARNFYIMQSAVAPMQSELPCYTPLTNHATDVHTVALVFASDYAALEAECERLREALRECLETMELFKLTGQVYVNGRTALSAKP